MVPILSLWLPILVAAILVFVVSSVIHMFLTYHRSDYGPIPGEDRVMQAMRDAGVGPGDYVMPYAGTPEAMKDPDFKAKADKGPVAFVTVAPPGMNYMGASLGQWFVYALVVGLFAGYVASRVLGPGAPYMEVFQITGTVAFVGYALALWQNSIWYKKSWVVTFKNTFDGLIYGLLTAGAFGWLWPGG